MSIEHRWIPVGSVPTVDTAFVTLRGAENRARISVGLTRLLDHFDASARLGGGSVRSHKETCVGCIVSLTTPTRSSLKASRSVSSLSLDENASRSALHRTCVCRTCGL